MDAVYRLCRLSSVLRTRLARYLPLSERRAEYVTPTIVGYSHSERIPPRLRLLHDTMPPGIKTMEFFFLLIYGMPFAHLLKICEGEPACTEGVPRLQDREPRG